MIKGNLSWWEADAYSWYESDDVRGHSLYSKRIFISHFMSNPRESRYGHSGFVVGFKDLLKYYQQSRTDVVNSQDRAVFLRVGGTLRYWFEICYVVIVCTRHDLELECYPSLYDHSNTFDHKGFVLPSGEIKTTFFESPESIDFKLKHVIKCVPTRQYSCYEAPGFAFYYPETSTTSSLKCPPDKVTKVPINHKCDRLCQAKRQKYFDELLDSLLNDDWFLICVHVIRSPWAAHRATKEHLSTHTLVVPCVA